MPVADKVITKNFVVALPSCNAQFPIACDLPIYLSFLSFLYALETNHLYFYTILDFLHARPDHVHDSEPGTITELEQGSSTAKRPK